MAFAAAVTVGAVLCLFEALVRSPRVDWTGARTPSSVISELVRSSTDIQVDGWPALLVPVVLVLLLGLLIDAVSGTRR